MQMIASLSMYRRAELDGAIDRFWQMIRRNLQAAGVDAPEHLSQTADEFSVWNDPNLVLSQTCGMPYRLWLHDKVQLVGTPDFGVDGCPPGYYRSAFVVRADDPRMQLEAFRDARFAYNERFSQSGYAAPYRHLEPKGFWFEFQLRTHSHLQAARAVATRKADIAALDAVTWALLQEHESFSKRLRVLEQTEPTPGLPLIAAQGQPAEAIFGAVETAIGQLEGKDRQALRLQGLVRIPSEAYLAIPNPPEQPWR